MRIYIYRYIYTHKNYKRIKKYEKYGTEAIELLE